MTKFEALTTQAEHITILRDDITHAISLLRRYEKKAMGDETIPLEATTTLLRLYAKSATLIAEGLYLSADIMEMPENDL